MCPPAPADITNFWSDEDVIKSLKNINSGLPLPANVIDYVDPYQVMPANLPEGVWYFCSEVNKKGKHGYWKASGEACDVYSNSFMTGWRTTLEFYEGPASHGQRTEWVMQEYWITEKEFSQFCKPKVSGVLCRVFMPDEKKMNNETQLQAHGERSPDHHLLENFAASDYISNGDYLELDDLLGDPDVPGSNFSSSVNSSSFRTNFSEEYFDPAALLRELEDEDKKQHEKCNSFKFIHSSTVKPKEVILRPAIIGSLTSGNGSTSPTKVTKKRDHMNEAVTSNSLDMVASSSRRSSNVSFKEEKKGLIRRMKKLKYLCFI